MKIEEFAKTSEIKLKSLPEKAKADHRFLTPQERLKSSEELKGQEARTCTWRLEEFLPTYGEEDVAKLKVENK